VIWVGCANDVGHVVSTIYLIWFAKVNCGRWQKI